MNYQYVQYIYWGKTKPITFCGKQPIKEKIALNNCVIEQVKVFYYLVGNLNYNYKYDLEEKISRFQYIRGTINCKNT